MVWRGPTRWNPYRRSIQFDSTAVSSESSPNRRHEAGSEASKVDWEQDTSPSIRSVSPLRARRYQVKIDRNRRAKIPRGHQRRAEKDERRGGRMKEDLSGGSRRDGELKEIALLVRRSDEDLLGGGPEGAGGAGVEIASEGGSEFFSGDIVPLPASVRVGCEWWVQSEPELGGLGDSKF